MSMKRGYMSPSFFFPSSLLLLIQTRHFSCISVKVKIGKDKGSVTKDTQRTEDQETSAY